MVDYAQQVQVLIVGLEITGLTALAFQVRSPLPTSRMVTLVAVGVAAALVVAFGLGRLSIAEQLVGLATMPTIQGMAFWVLVRTSKQVPTVVQKIGARSDQLG